MYHFIANMKSLLAHVIMLVIAYEGAIVDNASKRDTRAPVASIVWPNANAIVAPVPNWTTMYSAKAAAGPAGHEIFGSLTRSFLC